MKWHSGEHRKQANKEDLLDVCTVIGVPQNERVSVPDIRRALRKRLDELAARGVFLDSSQMDQAVSSG